MDVPCNHATLQASWDSVSEVEHTFSLLGFSLTNTLLSVRLGSRAWGVVVQRLIHVCAPIAMSIEQGSCGLNKVRLGRRKGQRVKRNTKNSDE